MDSDPLLDPNLDPVERAAISPDVYVFYEDTSDLVGRFIPEENPEVRFLADMRGWLWTAMAIVEVDDLYELQPMVDRILAGPQDPSDDSAKPVMYGSRALRRTRHFPYFGFARLQVVVGKAREVLDAINDDSTPGYAGSALVAGKFRILVEIGGDTPDELQARLAAVGDGIDGISDKETGELTGEYYYYRRPGEVIRKRRIGEQEESPS
jgi:hypothetical protein